MSRLHRPLVSIIIPAFNAQETIARPIQAAMGQTYTPIEIIVSDDGSTDETLSFVERRFRDLTAVTGENAGPNVARNRGAAVAKGDVLMFIDADDSMPRCRTERQLEALQAHRELGGLCAGVVKIYGNRIVRCDPPYLRGDVVTPSFVDIAYQRCGHMGPSLMVHRHAFETVGGFQRTVKEKALYMELAAAGYPIGRVNLPLYFLTRAEGTLRSKTLAMYRSELEILRRWDPRTASDSPLGEDDHLRLSLHWHLHFAGRSLQDGDPAMMSQCGAEARRVASVLGEKLPSWIRHDRGLPWLAASLFAKALRHRERAAIARARWRQCALKRRFAELRVEWPASA